MTQSLNVTSSYLNDLADTQDQASGDLAAAAKLTVGVTQNVWANNGVVCSEANSAVARAEVTRAAAYKAAQTTSTTLATNLRTSAAAYDGTDQQTAGTLGDQVPTA